MRIAFLALQKYCTHNCVAENFEKGPNNIPWGYTFQLKLLTLRERIEL